MARRKKNTADAGGGGGWLTTYADLMTLLLCFFVMLYAMSDVNEEKFNAVMQQIQAALLGQNGATIFDAMSLENDKLEGDPVENTEYADDDLIDDEIGSELDFILSDVATDVYGAVSSFLEEQGLSSDIQVQIVEEGLLLDIKETVFFDMGEATIKSQSLETLNKLLLLFEKFENEIKIIGHTDNVPINTVKYPSNWELAAARACAIVRYYASESLEPSRFVCTSYGDTQPVADNNTAEGRLQNRRVNFLIQATPMQLLEIADNLNSTLGESS